jgi:hypothetical protein
VRPINGICGVSREYNGKFHDGITGRRRWEFDGGCSNFTLEIGARGLHCRIDDLFHRLP